MKYKTFSIKDDAGINEFLGQHGEHVARDGIAFLDGNICIMYDDRTPAEVEKVGMINSAQAFINKLLAEMAGKDVDIRYWRRLAIKGVPGSDKNIVNLEDHMSNLRTQVQKAREIMKEIEDGTWDKDE